MSKRYEYSHVQTYHLINAIYNLWNRLFSTNQITSEQALTWLDLYPVDIIEESIKRGATWNDREIQKGFAHSEDELVRYTSAVMRNKLEARERYLRIVAAAEQVGAR